MSATELRRIFSRTTVRAGLSRPGFRPGPSHSSIRSWSGAWIVSFAALFVLAFVPATASAAPQGPWQVPAINLSATGQNASSPQIAFAPDGTATAVWTRLNGTNDIIQAATRPSGGTFGAAVDLSAAGQNAGTPQIAFAPDGTATAVWTRLNGTNTIIQAATRLPGGSFGSAVDLSAAGQNALSPQIGVAPDGTATAIWQRSNGTNSIIQAATRPPGDSFGVAVDLSAAGQSAFSPQIGVAPDGTATAIWRRSNGTNSIIQAATRPPGDSFGAAVDLSATGGNAASPQIGVAPDGTPTAVWYRFNGTHNIVQAKTSIGAPVDLSESGENAVNPQIAFAPDGSATAVWYRSNGTDQIVQAATRPSGGSFGAAVDLSATGGDAVGPQIGVAPDGTATAVWYRFNGTHNIVQAVTRPPRGSFGAAVDLSATGQTASDPEIGLAPDGSATAVWTRSNGTNDFIQAASTAQPRARIGRVTITGPSKLKKGRPATYKVRISNSGNADATGVRLKVSGRGVSFNTSVGKIAAGKTRTVKVKIKPKKTGKIKATFKVTSSNAGGKTVRKTITVK